MRTIELRVGQVSALLDKKLTGTELNALIGKKKDEYHCKYSPHDVRLARLKLKNNHNHSVRKPFVIATHSTHSGAGKTMLVANLGATLAWMGFRVLLIDGDSSGDLSRSILPSIENKRHINIGTIIQGEELKRALLPVYSDGMLSLVSSSPALSDSDYRMSMQIKPPTEFTGWLEREAKYLSDEYDVIVIDTCSYPTRLTLNLLMGAKLILGVIQLGENASVDAASLQCSLAIIKETQGITPPPLLFITNGMMPDDHQAPKILMALSEQYASALCDVVIPMQKKNASATTSIIAEREPNSYGAQSFFELAKQIVARHIEPLRIT